VDSKAQRLAAVTATVHGLVHACVLLLPPFIVDLRAAFGVSLLALGGAANAMYLAFGLAAIPGGWLADRLGSRRVLALSAGGCGLATAAAALAPTFGVLTAALIVLGACAGLHHPSGLSLVTRGVHGADRGRALGIHGMGGSLGEALAPVGAALAAREFGWRYGFAAAGALALVCAGLVLALEESQPQSGAAGRRPEIAAALRGFWRSPPLRWLLLASAAGGFAYRGALTFLPLHLSGGAGGALPGAGLITLVLLAGTAAQLVGGTLADRLPRERLFVVELLFFAPVLVSLALGSGGAGVAMAIAFGFLWSLLQPLASVLAATHAEARDHGLLYGVQLALSFGVGSFATTLGAALATRGGTRLAFLGFGVAAAFQLAAAVAVLRATRGSAAGRSAVGSRVGRAVG
jgi:predicted MFS family arabinose efflux permease